MNIFTEIVLPFISLLFTMILVTLVLPYLEKKYRKMVGKKYLEKVCYTNLKLSKLSLYRLWCIFEFLAIDEKEMLIDCINSQCYELDYNVFEE